MRSMVEGAQAMRKFLKCRRSVDASAPPTAQTRGPPSPLSWGGMKRPVVTEKGEFL
jgi:hypothetical protein